MMALREIPIEQRSGDEVAKMTGPNRDGRIETVTSFPTVASRQLLPSM